MLRGGFKTYLMQDIIVCFSFAAILVMYSLSEALDLPMMFHRMGMLLDLTHGRQFLGA